MGARTEPPGPGGAQCMAAAGRGRLTQKCPCQEADKVWGGTGLSGRRLGQGAWGGAASEGDRTQEVGIN